MSRYAIVVERASERSWSACAPDLPGRAAVGDTREASMAEAIEFHIEGLRRHGYPVPRPTDRRLDARGRGLNGLARGAKLEP